VHAGNVVKWKTAEEFLKEATPPTQQPPPSTPLSAGAGSGAAGAGEGAGADAGAGAGESGGKKAHAALLLEEVREAERCGIDVKETRAAAESVEAGKVGVCCAVVEENCDAARELIEWVTLSAPEPFSYSSPRPGAGACTGAGSGAGAGAGAGMDSHAALLLLEEVGVAGRGGVDVDKTRAAAGSVCTGSVLHSFDTVELKTEVVLGGGEVEGFKCAFTALQAACFAECAALQLRRWVCLCSSVPHCFSTGKKYIFIASIFRQVIPSSNKKKKANEHNKKKNIFFFTSDFN
jgi:hypothetical protein